MNTNDEQAPYGPTAEQAADRLARALKDMDKPTERAPLLSKEWIHKMRAIMLPSEHRESTLYAYEMGAMDVLGAIEAKITSGELMTRADFELMVKEAFKLMGHPTVRE